MSSPAVLVLDDGELDDVQGILEELGVAFARVRGGAIVRGTQAPSDLLVATPRRVEAVERIPKQEKGPTRVVVSGEDSNAMRAQMRRIGFDYLVRRPVHPEALRLLLLRCLYKGDERRDTDRVAVGSEVSFRAGLLTRRATLADLSLGGCRLLSRTPIEAGKRIRVQIPEALDTGEPFTLTGRVLRSAQAPGSDDEPHTSLGVLFDRMSEDARAALDSVLEDRAQGPATLRPSTATAQEAVPAAASPQGLVEAPFAGSPGRHDTRRMEIPVEVGIEPERKPDETVAEARKPRDASQDERRRGPRVDYQQTVPAFGKRALRVLVGRDLSTGGMRIDPLPGLEIGDRLHLAIYGEPGEAPFLIWATVARDDDEGGLGLLFDPVEPGISSRLESIVGTLPAVENLHDDEIEAMGTVMSEILEG